MAKTEWPKVHSDNLGTNNAFIGMSVDPNNGNVFTCGWSLMDTDVPKAYPNANKKLAINFLINNIGDVQWHFAFRSAKASPSDLTAQGCRFSKTGDSMFTLI